MTTTCSTVSRRARAERFRVRAFVSLTLVTSGVIVLGSGLLLLFAPSGRLAAVSGWAPLGVARQDWVALHDVFGLLWLPLLIVHVVLNRKPILCYLRDRVRRAAKVRWEAVAAVGVTLLLVGVTLSRPAPLTELLAQGHGGAGNQSIELSVGAGAGQPTTQGARGRAVE